MVAYRVTDAAKRDFAMVLRETTERYGAQQRDVYKGLIAKAVEMIAEDLARGGSWDRGRIVPGLRAFHLDHAAGRRGAAAHTLYYAVDKRPAEPPVVVVLRLLHERMEPDRRIPQGA